MRIHTLQENSAKFRTCVKRCARCAFGRARRILIVRPYTFQSVNTLSVSIVPMSESKVSQVIPTAPVPVVYWGRHRRRHVPALRPARDHAHSVYAGRGHVAGRARPRVSRFPAVLVLALLCGRVQRCRARVPELQYLDRHQQDSAAVMMGHWVRLSCNH